MKKKQKVKPRLWGVCFEGEALDNEEASSQLVKSLGGFKGILTGNNICIETTLSSSTIDIHESASNIKSSRGAKAKNVPEEAVPHLIKMLHGNNNSKKFLIKEFTEFWKKTGYNVGTQKGKEIGQSAFSKKKLNEKILEIADYKMLVDGGVKCWWVKHNILTRFKTMPAANNEWSYTLEKPSIKKNKTASDDHNVSKSGLPDVGTPDEEIGIFVYFDGKTNILSNDKYNWVRSGRKKSSLCENKYACTNCSAIKTARRVKREGYGGGRLKSLWKVKYINHHSC